MKLGAAFVCGFLFGLAPLGAREQGSHRGPDADRPKWWPSEWGPADQRGAANRLTAERVKEASRLIRDGKVYSLGRLYEHGMPLPGKRHFSLTIPGSPTGGPTGKNQGVYHDDLFSGEIGQIGTQLDGLGHVGVRIGGDDYFYNGFRRVAVRHGLRPGEARHRERRRVLHARRAARRGEVARRRANEERRGHHRARPRDGRSRPQGSRDPRGGRRR